MILVSIALYYEATSTACDILAQQNTSVVGVFPNKEQAEKVAAKRILKLHRRMRKERRQVAMAKRLESWMPFDYQLVNVLADIVELVPDGDGGYLYTRSY